MEEEVCLFRNHGCIHFWALVLRGTFCQTINNHILFDKFSATPAPNPVSNNRDTLKEDMRLCAKYTIVYLSEYRI